MDRPGEPQRRGTRRGLAGKGRAGGGELGAVGDEEDDLGRLHAEVDEGRGRRGAQPNSVSFRFFLRFEARKPARIGDHSGGKMNAGGEGGFAASPAILGTAVADPGGCTMTCRVLAGKLLDLR